MNAEWQTQDNQPNPVVYGLHKEPPLKLSLETRNLSDIIVVHCQGRIVYRDEAAALSQVVGELLQDTGKLVVDLSGVTSMDSAGIGEIALLQTWAMEKNASLKWAGAQGVVQALLGLTNLDTVLELHPSVDAAVDSFCEDQMCADC